MISQIGSIVAYTIPVVILAPLILGPVTNAVSEYSENNAQFQDPINIVINYFFCIAFYACLIILYLYRNKEMKLQFQKNTVDGCVLPKELLTYMKQYGIADMLYYTVCTIIIMLLIDGGMESGIFFAVENSIVRTVLCVLMFIVVYTVSVVIILKIWDKQRPEYLKKGYVDKDNA